jgi:regulatory protein
VAPAPSGSPATLKTVRASALALLARRDYTAAELTTRLEDRGLDPALVAAAIADLRDTGAIDDRRTADAHARRARAIKGRGRYRIARELAARGISDDLIDDALRQWTPDDEFATIRRILTRRRLPDSLTIKERQRWFRHLLGRGFDADLIRRALGRPGFPDDTEDS